VLALEDGTVLRGRSVGAAGRRAFELVFNTSMTGYQEILTDPSYTGQAVVMTYPQIGNYGCNPIFDESARCWAEGFVMRQLTPRTSSWQSTEPLDAYLRRHGVVAMDGVDTRELTIKLREQGALRGVISTQGEADAELIAQARAHPSLDGQDLTGRVSCAKSYAWSEGLPDPVTGKAGALAPNAVPVVCYDFGIKRNILRNLVAAGFAPTVVPATTPAAEVLARRPAGVFFSNGPGDPAAVLHAHRAVRELAEAGMPIFGICLGHQLIGLAFGARTFKMKFGHHGANHPVLERSSGRVDIASHNHGFAVDPDSLAGTGLEVTHWNANDQSVAGMRHQELPIFSVQYHPEAGPGPHDPRHLFERFMELTRSKRPAATAV
jgi:carbamoyl-phosphate synthase small subunit